VSDSEQIVMPPQASGASVRGYADKSRGLFSIMHMYAPLNMTISIR
jgi:hypothetical protein